MLISKRNTVLISPIMIVFVNFLVAYFSGIYIGKWSFIPIILVEWFLFVFFIFKYTDLRTRYSWFKKSNNSFRWNVASIVIGILPMPLFLMHYETLGVWKVWLPWAIIALINPWIEECYWRGLLRTYTSKWPTWVSVLFSSILFSANHAVFGLHSVLNSGFTVIISTFFMGLVWSFTFYKTNSLRWVIISHFLVDFFNLSSASFLDLY